MRLWPFQRRETRADSSYTDALVASITANASGKATAFPTATAALEASAGLIGRAFASATIQGAPDHVIDSVTPGLLNLAGRALIRRGEAWLISGAGSWRNMSRSIASRAPGKRPASARSSDVRGPCRVAASRLPRPGARHTHPLGPECPRQLPLPVPVPIPLPKRVLSTVSAAPEKLRKFLLKNGLDRGSDVLPQPVLERIIAGVIGQ